MSSSWTKKKGSKLFPIWCGLRGQSYHRVHETRKQGYKGHLRHKTAYELHMLVAVNGPCFQNAAIAVDELIKNMCLD